MEDSLELEELEDGEKLEDLDSSREPHTLLSLNIRDHLFGHKKLLVTRIHDPGKIVVPCTVFEAESPIPPDRSMQFSSYI
ncbi:hypothetical protein HID58_014714, partial [Brassica napus]